MQSEEAECRVFTFPDAALNVSIPSAEERLHKDEAEIRVFGNRPGIASLASILLWFYHSFDREFLSLTGLSFVAVEGKLALTIRKTDEARGEEYGHLVLRGKGSQYEWLVDEEDLRRLAIEVHGIASKPYLEYLTFPYRPRQGAAIIHVRLTDVRKWI